MQSEMFLRSLKALADPTRMHIIEFLSSMCCGQAAVNELGEVEGATAGEVCCHITGADKVTSTVSHHLHELEDAGLIRIERKGKFMVCTLRAEQLEAIADNLQTIAKSNNGWKCC